VLAHFRLTRHLTDLLQHGSWQLFAMLPTRAPQPMQYTGYPDATSNSAHEHTGCGQKMH
jgi:hypothetical protein